MSNDVRTRTQPIVFDPADRPLGVLVGFDGSEQGTLALHYAARAAQRRSAPLTVVHSYTVPAVVSGYVAPTPEVSMDTLTRQGAEEVLKQAREYLAEYPGEVTFRIEYGDAAGVLVALSDSARLAVVGGRGVGGFLGRILGSVSSALPAHAKCPTVVVPRQYSAEIAPGADFAPVSDDRPVVAGVDGSSFGRVAALYAAQAAADRRTSLRLVLALPPLNSTLMWYPELAPRDDHLMEQRIAELQEKLTSETEWLASHFPGLEITAAVESGSAVEVLSAATKTSQLTVVGTHGRGGLSSTLLGSVSRGVLLHAAGPVLVVPKLADQRLENQPHFGQ